MNINFVREDSFPFKFSIKNKQGDNITAEDIDTQNTAKTGSNDILITV